MVFFNVKVPVEGMIQRGSILHEFTHIKINKARFSTAEEYVENTLKYYDYTWFDEAETNFLMKFHDQRAFETRVRELAVQTERDINELIRKGPSKIAPKAIEAVAATKQLAKIAGDQESILRLEQLEQKIINSGRTTSGKISDLNNFFDNLFNNKMKNDKILDQRDSEKEILDLFKIIQEVRT